MLIGVGGFGGEEEGRRRGTWQNTKRSDDTEGHEDTTGPIALLYMFDLAAFRLFGGVEVFFVPALCQKRKEGKFQTLKFKESLTVQPREERR